MAANYNGAQAYRFELFEPQQAMPAPKKRKFRSVRSEWSKRRKDKGAETGRSKRNKQAHRRYSHRVVVMFMLLGINMYSRTRLTVLAQEAAKIQTSISEEQSRTVDLQSRLTQKMSTDAVLDYATNRLGMVKGNRSQINYITVNGSDSVVYNDDSGSKAGE